MIIKKRGSIAITYDIVERKYHMKIYQKGSCICKVEVTKNVAEKNSKELKIPIATVGPD